MFQLDPEQQSALDAMLAGENLFLTGEAGTGKSTVLREFRSRTNPDACVFLAPTGVAAIQTGGTTIHSLFLLPPTLLTPDTLEPLAMPKRRALLRAVKTVVIDEISMVRSDLLWAIDQRLRAVSQGNACAKPFGGRQMIVIGDFFQLPPVVKSQVEMEYLQQLGGCYAFQTDLWKSARFHCICLHQVHRQADDLRFARLLNEVRHGRLLEATIPPTDAKSDMPSCNVLEALMTCCSAQRSEHAAEGIPPIVLTTTNREADAINAEQKARLKGNAGLFTAVVNGRFAAADFPTEACLELKPGARVMVLCNKHLPDGDFAYVNGDLGVVVKIDPTSETPVTVRLDKGTEVELGPTRWDNYEYILETDPVRRRKCIRQRTVGSFVQIPLRLAYAITIHKAQGLTLEKVDLKLGNGCFAHGQLYTALSRCRRLQGLHTDRPVLPEDLIIDQEVIDFYDTLARDPKTTDSNVLISIPPEHEAAVRALLAKLQGGDNAPIETPEPQLPQPTSLPDEDKLDDAISPQEDDEDVEMRIPSKRRLYHPGKRGSAANFGNVTASPELDKLMSLYRRNAFRPANAPILIKTARFYETNGYIKRWQAILVHSILKTYPEE